MAQVYTKRITAKQDGWFSSSREYLRVDRNGYAFDIAAIQFAHGVYISWRFGEITDTPEVAKTYYQEDTQKAFRRIVQRSVSAAIEQLNHQQAIRQQDLDE